MSFAVRKWVDSREMTDELKALARHAATAAMVSIGCSRQQLIMGMGPPTAGRKNCHGTCSLRNSPVEGLFFRQK